MKAVILEAFGGAEQLHYQTVDSPQILPPMHVLVRVHASGVNPLDIQTRRADYADSVRLPLILGSEASGVVEAVGEGVDNVGVGDEVFYMTPLLAGAGTYAEQHVVPAAVVVRKPSTLTHVEAAALPLAAGTAWQCLFERGRISPSDSVLIHAGAGGVGSLAIQMAAISGARVLTTCQPANESLVRELGASHAIDYKRTDFVAETLSITDGRGVDVVIDTVGGDTFQRSIDCLAFGGRLVSIVDHDQPHNLLNAYNKNAVLHFVFTSPDPARLATIATLVERGQLRPVINADLPLPEAAEAHRRIERGDVRGKIVLRVD
jgi:NADPH:quinone reductase-like Zn-dependent oxidoreductase